MIKKTEFYVRLQTLKISKPQPHQKPLQKGNDDLQMPERDVDIFALVDHTQNKKKRPSIGTTSTWIIESCTNCKHS